MMKDGKLFGKISIIDIAAVLIFVLLIAGIYIKFSGNQTVSIASGETIECTVKVKDVRDYTVDALKKGGAVYDITTKEYIGEIKEVTSEPAETSLLMEDGNYRIVETGGRYNAYVTLTFTGKAGDSGYYTAANKQISVGSTLEMNAKYSQCTGNIVDVKSVK